MNSMLTLGPERERYQRVARLLAPVRNRYFYGKLLDADHLELEQRYFLERGRLINRLTLGTGVLCGLKVMPRGAEVVVSPGVAVDGFGREILVTEPVTVDPWSLIPETSDVPDALVLTLCYHECDAEPAPVLVVDCELREECMPSVVRERFALRALDARTWRPEGGIDERTCRALFGGEAPVTQPPVGGSHVIHVRGGQPSEAAPAAEADRSAALEALHRAFERIDSPYDTPHSDLREQVCELLAPTCAPGPECVPIALVTRAGDSVTVDDCAVRTSIYSNSTLLDLILCLAERVEECCDGHRVRLQAPVVKDMFPAPFTTVTRTEYRNELDGNAFSLTFDHEMDAGRLAAPADWLRLILVATVTMPATSHTSAGVENTVLFNRLAERRPIEVTGDVLETPAGAGDTTSTDTGDTGDTSAADQTVSLAAILPVTLADTQPAGGGQRATYAYSEDSLKMVTRLTELLKTSMQVAIVIRSDDLTQIADTSDPPELLDADFAGTALPHTLLEMLWWLDGTKPLLLPVTTTTGVELALPAGSTPPSLPSGNGIEGGLFHAWFAIDLTA